MYGEMHCPSQLFNTVALSCRCALYVDNRYSDRRANEPVV